MADTIHRPRVCRDCGESYRPQSRYQKLCPACRAKARDKSVVLPRQCRQCGITFDGGPRAWYCPACRADRKKAADRRQKRYGPARSLGSVDQCIVCGGDYVIMSGTQRYCPQCAPAAVTAIDRKAALDWIDANQARHSANRARSKPSYRPCIICGKTFVAQTPSVTCSPECALSHKRNIYIIADFKRGKRATLPDHLINIKEDCDDDTQ